LKRFNPWFIASAAILAALLVGPVATAAEDKTLNEKILDILLEQGTIDRDRYEALTLEAQEEKRLLAEAREPRAEKPSGWSAFWRDGLRVERNDGLVKVRMGGRIQLDAAGASLEGPLEKTRTGSDIDGVPGERFDGQGQGVDFRRVRLFTEASFGEHGFARAQFEFTGGEVGFRDVYVGLRELPALGTLRIGRFKEPASLEQLTSSKYNTFMERGLPVLAFGPFRNTGIGARNAVFDQRMTWSAGFFRLTGSDGEDYSSQANYNASVRVTALPLWEDEGQTFVHTGFWYSHQFRGSEVLQYEPNAESNTVGTLLSMPEILTDGVNLVGAELALVQGPLSVQAEYIHSFVQGAGSQRDVDFYGNYVAVSYFLTGEHRVYDRKKGAFTRTRPTNPFSIREGSYGALEIAGRWSILDLNDQDVRGGILNNFTGAVNWYLYDNLRVMLNYVLASRNGIGDAHIVQSRVAVDF
jgi:phosphate-selective porin OprO/OprP